MADPFHDAVYLDHAAASPPAAQTLAQWQQYALHCFANQEAIHLAAYAVRRALDEHEARMLAALCGPGHDAAVQWTDSGTSALYHLLSYPGFAAGEVVTTAAEHAALTAALGPLDVPVKTVRLCRGRVDLDHLASMLGPATATVAIHQVQSEFGAVQDLTAIRRVIDARAPQARFLADTVQAAGKLELPWQAARLDAAIVSGYKIGVPGGGAIIYRDHDGSPTGLRHFWQRRRREEHRISRPNPPMCLTLAQTLTELTAQLAANRARLSGLNDELRRELQRRWGERIKWVVEAEAASPYLVHFLLPGYQGAVLVRMLSEHGVYVASGSACNAETKTPSAALLAAGIKVKEAFSGLRLSFSPATTREELARFLTVFETCLNNY
ncbi:MAG: aminotransferase class V-fold PLP-dependent enzyme [Victivallales bacterium]|nr:aminotransferase class V-fold PLP-dependent enzyme [Victivallales bacterium]